MPIILKNATKSTHSEKKSEETRSNYFTSNTPPSECQLILVRAVLSVLLIHNTLFVFVSSCGILLRTSVQPTATFGRASSGPPCMGQQQKPTTASSSLGPRCSFLHSLTMHQNARESCIASQGTHKQDVMCHSHCFKTDQFENDPAEDLSTMQKPVPDLLLMAPHLWAVHSHQIIIAMCMCFLLMKAETSRITSEQCRHMCMRCLICLVVTWAWRDSAELNESMMI